MKSLIVILTLLPYVSSLSLPSVNHQLDPHFAAPACQSIYMPPNLCPNCRMLPFNETGRFENQRFIYDIDDPLCRRGLEEYVQLNPCDHVRRAQMSNLTDEINRRRIGVFMYAVCETCCDCIPIGSRADQYDERKAARNLTAVVRGNCPVHLHYDTCKMWPRIKNIARPGGPQNLYRHQVCPLVRQWYNSPARMGWGRNPRVRGMDWRIKRFLWQFKTFAHCESETLWKECAALEVAQRRV